MVRYKDYDRTQGMFLTADLLGKQLLPGTSERTVDHIVDRLDLSGFDRAQKISKSGFERWFMQMTFNGLRNGAYLREEFGEMIG
jgi:hypothetical protein